MRGLKKKKIEVVGKRLRTETPWFYLGVNTVSSIFSITILKSAGMLIEPHSSILPNSKRSQVRQFSMHVVTFF